MAMINYDTLEIPPITWRKAEWKLRPHGTPARARYHYRHEGKGWKCEACREAEALRLAEYQERVAKVGHRLGGRWPR